MKRDILSVFILRKITFICLIFSSLNLFAQQPGAPLIIWENPLASDSKTNQNSYTVKARIDSKFELQNVEILVNNISDKTGEKVIVPDGRGSYSLTQLIRINPGKNTVVVLAANSKGVTYSAKRTISLVSGSMPEIKLLSPLSKDSLNITGKILVRTEIITRSPLQTFDLMVNGKAQIITNIEWPVKKDSITYQFEKRVDLQNGLNTFSIQAGNQIGIASSGVRSILFSKEPVIRWVSPSAVNNFTDRQVFTLKAEIGTPFELQNALVNFNGILLPQDKADIKRISEGTYLFEKQISLSPGKNSVYIQTANSKGIASSSSRFIGYLMPVIRITDPAYNDSIVATGTVMLKAEIKSYTPLQSVRLFFNGRLQTGEQAKQPELTDSVTYKLENRLQLQSGTNIFYLEAKNSLGTSVTEKHTLIWKVEPFIVWINPSTYNSVIPSSVLELKAVIKSKFDLQSVRVKLNDSILADEGGAITRQDNDSYIYERKLKINPGENTLQLDAGNAKGIGYSTTMVIKGRPDLAVSVRPQETKVQPPAEKTDGKFTVQDQRPVKETLVADKKSDDKPVIVVAESKPESKPDSIQVKSTVAEAKITAVPPEIDWVSPSSPKTDINLNSGKIKTRIRSSERPKSLLVYVNGTASEEVARITETDKPGEFAFEKVIDFQPGENNIYLVASNSAGTIKSEIRYLTNPPTNPPVVSWTVPSGPKAIVSSEIISIEACIKSATTLKTVQIFVNGVQQASEMMFQNPLLGDCSYRFSKDVILKEGDNSVFIIASNFAGSTNSDRRLIRYETKMVSEKRLALVIGNADYGNSNVLKNPVNDANLIEGTLKNLGFEVIKSVNATKEQMMLALRDFSKKLPDYNVALFYYAGHGIQVDGQNFLIPVDATMKEKADCKWESVPVNYIVEEFEKVPDNINIVILDACRNNPFRSWVRGGEEGFRALNPVSGTIVSFATSEGSTAADGSGSNGAYTEELVKQMVIPQAISSVFINTRKEVMKKTNNTQRPQEWNMLTGEFYFAR
jgi:hypothetical protein